NQPVFAERLFVEKDPLGHPARLVEILVVDLLEFVNLNVEFRQQAFGLRAVQVGAGNRLRTTIANDETIAAAEFIPFCVPAEIIVIIENQYLCVRANLLTIKISSRQSADSRADND